MWRCLTKRYTFGRAVPLYQTQSLLSGSIFARLKEDWRRCGAPLDERPSADNKRWGFKREDLWKLALMLAVPVTERVVDDIQRGYYERQGRIQYPRLWESRELSTASSTLSVTNDRQGRPTAPSATMTTTATRILDQANAASTPLTQHMRSITAVQMVDEQQWWIPAAHRILTSGLPTMPTPLELRALASWIDGTAFRGLQMMLDVHAEAGSPSRVGRWQWIPKTPDESDEEERRSTDERSKRRRNRRNS